jgi:hypothetical protein
VTSNISFSYPGSGTYDAAYDVWLDPTPKKDGVNKQELMIWFNRQGQIQPVGSKVASATIGGRTWEVWTGNNGANDVVSYVAPSPIKSWNFNILDFINDTKTRSGVTNSWYLTSIQAGFEPWQGGTGLTLTSFAASVNGHSGNGGGRIYMVRAGDTLTSIAERMNVTGGWQSLYERNRNVLGADPDLIRPGQQLSL